jgi:hypothetical protein
VRSLIDWLELTGAAMRHPGQGDLRERPLYFTGWLPPAISAIAEEYLCAISPWRQPSDQGASLDGQSRKAGALAVGAGRMLATAPQVMPMGPETRLFANHEVGFPVFLEILGSYLSCAKKSGANFSRKTSARRYGVSRAHLTSLLARAEQAGMLVRADNKLVLSERRRQQSFTI